MQDNSEILKLALAKVVKRCRVKSITRVCDEIGISKSILSDLEQGKKDIFFSTFWRIAEALEVSPSELVALIEKELPDSFSFLND